MIDNKFCQPCLVNGQRTNKRHVSMIASPLH